MARSVDRDQPESPGFELDELERSIRSSFRLHGSSSRGNSIIDDEYELQWAAIERLGTFERVRKSVVDENGSSSEDQKVKKKKVVDVTKLGASERRLLIEKLIKHIQNDNLRLWSSEALFLTMLIADCNPSCTQLFFLANTCNRPFGSGLPTSKESH